MSEDNHEKRANYRRERIDRLLHELEYELTRGMMEREIDESVVYRFYVPISQSIPDGVVRCEFSARPVHRHEMLWDPSPKTARLQIVK